MSDGRSADGYDSSQQASPSGDLLDLPFEETPSSSTIIRRPVASTNWRPILSDSTQVVLYNPASHAISVRRHESVAARIDSCPYCHRPLQHVDAEALPYFDADTMEHTRASNYFQLLEISNDITSRPASPNGSAHRSTADSGVSHAQAHSDSGASGFRADAMAEGYFNAFFKEEQKLGMGANGSVFLCQHVLDGNPLGHFAVKKIAVGQSHSYLIKILREVRLLETFRHPNIVTYHHAWLETYQFSSFGPRVPTLFVLMQWAEGGSLDDFIEARLGNPGANVMHSNPPSDGVRLQSSLRSRSDRIRAFRNAQKQPKEERERRRAERLRGVQTAVHLLSAEEAKRLFCDVASGLAFLHDRSILHLDLKPGNVLLTWDEGSLIPRAMLSDFGTSRDMIQPERLRTGNTGTLEYAAPESLPSPSGILSQVDSKADMWSLGMILHALLFFRLPYGHSSSGDYNGQDRGDLNQLEKEILEYPGFRYTPAMVSIFESRGLPSAYLALLESLLNTVPRMRPPIDRVVRGIREGSLDPVPFDSSRLGEGTLVPRMPSLSEQIEAVAGPEASASEVTDDDDGIPDGLDTPTQARKEESPVRTLPRPLPPPAFIPQLIQPVLVPWAGEIRDLALPTRYFIRGLKSCILAIKVFMLLSLCPDGRPEPLFMCFLLGVAISDTWSEDLWISVLLALLHAVILRLHCINGKCCV